MGLTVWGGVLAACAGFCAYTYAGYPWLLARLGKRRRPHPAPPVALEEWPFISIVLPVFNEAASIAGTLEAILALDYPPDRREVLVISDHSDDGTDEIVRGFEPRGGIRLLRLPGRAGKTAAENAAARHVRGSVVVGIDASVRPHPASLKLLVAALSDPAVGIASGCDISTAAGTTAPVAVETPEVSGEQSYVGYEMRIRELETRLGGIVGASGCLYASRDVLYRREVPVALSRDFAAALHAREQGYAAVSVSDALCYVPRSSSFAAEYRRKVRTIERGLATLLHHRRLLDPLRYGTFSWMLASHKLCRWLTPWALLGALVAVAALSTRWAPGRWLAAVAGAGIALSGVACASSSARRAPGLAQLAYAASGNVATLHAWVRLVLGRRRATWDPTRRQAAAHQPPRRPSMTGRVRSMIFKSSRTD
jgi:glycosyltransferase involved in cell wall biosynthesis